MNSKIKLIGILLGVVLLVSLVFGFANYLQNRSLDAIIKTEVVPSDAKITIDGKKAREGENRVKAGTYEVVFSREGFSKETRQVIVGKDSSQYVGAVLNPVDPKYADWYSDHPEDIKKAEGISSRSFDQLGTNKLREVPFIKSLPYVRASYRIDYGVSQKYTNDPSKFAIYISYKTDKDKETALEWINSQGTDPATLEIIYEKIL